jgi:large subunit ribosomal protein L5
MAKDTGSQETKAKDKAKPATKASKAKSAPAEKAKAAQSAGGAAGSGTQRANQAAESTPRLQQRYREDIIKALMGDFNYSNVNQVPRIQKVVINFGLGEAVLNPNIVKTATEELTVIAGQRPVVTRAKKAIANFKLRAGLPIGCMVTLRRDRMWEFLDRLISIAIPRIRDFKGVSSKAFDGRGNYSMGLREQIVFPEIDYDKVEKVKGFNVTITTTAKTDEEGRALLRHLGMPFRN